jgi:hypothetical protein
MVSLSKQTEVIMSKSMMEYPGRLFHGTADDLTGRIVRPLYTSQYFVRVHEKKYSRWANWGPEPEVGMPYANVIWEALGLRKRSRNPELVPEWAKHIKSYHDLSRQFGILFVTDNEKDAERYGKPYEIDLDHPSILTMIKDPHIRTHNAWILIMKAGEYLPVVGQIQRETITEEQFEECDLMIMEAAE